MHALTAWLQTLVTPSTPRRTTTGQSTRTLAVAFAANVCVALTKLTAALVTGSPAMTAEATHAFADVGNQMLLLVARHTSRRPRDARHPFGHGREAYFWALVASLGVFVAGALFSLREGVVELLHPVAAAASLAVYPVLAICLALDSASLSQSSRQLRREARGLHRDFLDQLVLTSDPTVRAVFVEDAAAIAGDLIAAAGIALHHATASCGCSPASASPRACGATRWRRWYAMSRRHSSAPRS